LQKTSTPFADNHFAAKSQGIVFERFFAVNSTSCLPPNRDNLMRGVIHALSQDGFISATLQGSP